MKAINVFVLPILAFLIVVGPAIMAWLIYRPAKIKKIRPAPPPKSRLGTSKRSRMQL